MKVMYRCGCGLHNYTWEDWIAHYKYGTKGKLRALILFLTTKIELHK